MLMPEWIGFTSTCRQCGASYHATYDDRTLYRRIALDAENAHAVAHPECPSRAPYGFDQRASLPSEDPR